MKGLLFDLFFGRFAKPESLDGFGSGNAAVIVETFPSL